MENVREQQGTGGAGARAVSLKDAADQLDAARESYKDAQKQTSIARNYECNALNRLNDAQKAFDRIIEGIKKQSALEGSEWERATRMKQQVVAAEVS